MEKTGIIICGSKGRMGGAIISVIPDYGGLLFIGGVDSNYTSYEISEIESGKVSPDKFLTLKEALHSTAGIQNKVVIDFTSKGASLIHAEEAALYNVPIVIGSTGFSESELKTVEGYGKHIPIVLSGNMSLGVNVLLNIVYDASKYLGENYDCEIIETHHKRKKTLRAERLKCLPELSRNRGI